MSEYKSIYKTKIITMKQKISESVKSILAKYGLKDSSRAKIEQIVANKIEAMGEVGAEDLSMVIEQEVKACEPFAAILQSEIEVYRQRNNNTPPDTKDEKNVNFDELMAKMLQDFDQKLKDATTPLLEKIDKMESEKAATNVLTSVRSELFATNAGKNPEFKAQMESAIRFGTKLFNAGGNKLSSEELKSLIISEFNECSSTPYDQVPEPNKGGENNHQESAIAALMKEVQAEDESIANGEKQTLDYFGEE